MIVIPGIGLMAIPEFILDLFKLSHGDHLWMARIIGLLAFGLGIYYFYIAKYKIAVLYNTTVVLRYFASIFMVGLWLTGQVEIMILLFAAVDTAGATWTMITIKNSA